MEDVWFGIGQGEIGGAKVSATGEGREARNHSSAEGKACAGSQGSLSPVPIWAGTVQTGSGLAQGRAEARSWEDPELIPRAAEGRCSRNAGRNQLGVLKSLLKLQKLRPQMFWRFFSPSF